MFKRFGSSQVRAAAAAVDAAAAERKRAPNGDGQFIWPYTEQYATLASEGPRHPPPEFGTPTLIWHMGIWPKHMPGDSPKSASIRAAFPISLSAEQRRWREAELFDADNTAFYGEVNAFLLRLQAKGRIEGAAPNHLMFAPSNPLPGTKPNTVYPFAFGRPQAVAFSLWWRDEDEAQGPAHEPQPSDLRVRVQAQAALDHATISIFIDAGKPWGEEYLVRGTQAFAGKRRHRIVDHVSSIRRLVEDQATRGYVDLDVLPENGVDADTARKLVEASDYLYKGIWNDFSDSFDLKSWTSATSLGERFSESRGLVVSIAGIDSPAEAKRKEQTSALRKRVVTNPEGTASPSSEGTIGVGAFPAFDPSAGEPNTVIKALLPFLRRSHAKFDERELVACGILDWRALFITSLSTSTNADPREESPGGFWETPGGHLPEESAMREAGTKNRPNRHLFVTKGEPHRMQIGRFIERVNAAESIRIFAVKNWATIQNASVHLRILSRELDHLLTEWSDQRLVIDGGNRARLEALQEISNPKERARKADNYSGIHVEELYALINTTESRLISLAAGLDKIGQDGAGRLMFVLNRSHQFVREFERILTLIHVGDIPTWLNYKNFVSRGMRSSFDTIESTQSRMESLRERIQTITEVVQTSALIIEAEATKQNTRELRLMARNYTTLQIATILSAAAVFLQALSFVVSQQDLRWFLSGLQNFFR